MGKRLPSWLRKASISGSHETLRLLRRHRLHTVCEEARCPNRGLCFSKPTATFLILGDTCTRNCGFCSVTPGNPTGVDPEEPERVAQAAKEMGLRYVVITSVTRDDLPDGGASQFAATIRAIRRHLPGARVEVLTPDFMGSEEAIKTVVEAGPDVFNHNLETVPRLYSRVRPQADYQRSLNLLRVVHRLRPSMPTKSGLMVGLGETFEEVVSVMEDLRTAGCTLLTIGQYLRPKRSCLEVVEFIRPEVFEQYRRVALRMGFHYVASHPMARSSMNAEEMYP